jgi:dTDP-4-amino-4,6-dideoxygalactose transaminase
MLEERFAERCGVAHAIAVNNCTAGLHLALLALGVGPGDEVLVADYTFPATGHAVLYTGARPVFVDVDPLTATINPDLVSAAITSRTRGIVAVDALGQPADYAALELIAARHQLFLLEDGACSAGASYRGRPTGSFGDVAAFSLHARKGITCGEGGIVTTNREDIARSVRKLSCFGMVSAFERQATAGLPIPVFDEPGYNYKLSDILAAIALVQLDRLERLLERRRAVADAYHRALSRIPGITPPHEAADRRHVWQTYAVTVHDALDRDAIAVYLRENGVQCNIGTYASHVQPVYGPRRPGEAECPESARLLRRHLAIPLHADLTAAEIDRVVSVIGQAVDHQWRGATRETSIGG